MTDAAVPEPGGIGQDDSGIDRALEWASECNRDGADQPKAALRRRRHFLYVLPLGRARLLQVLHGVRFARRDQQADLVHAETGIEIGECTLDRAHIGAGRLVVDAVAPRQRRQQRARIGELRHHLRIGIRRGFHPLKAEIGEALDQPPLGVGRHEIRFVLQAVAREALAEDDIAHQAAPACLLPIVNRSMACSRSLFFCTLPLAVMPMASKLSTIAR